MATPVDQHQLLALIAPRRVVLVDGEADTWADPEGARQAAEAAGPAWVLFGKEGFGKEIVWKSRAGGHEVRPSDWTLFLDGMRAVEQAAGRALPDSDSARMTKDSARPLA